MNKLTNISWVDTKIIRNMSLSRTMYDLFSSQAEEACYAAFNHEIYGDKGKVLDPTCQEHREEYLANLGSNWFEHPTNDEELLDHRYRAIKLQMAMFAHQLACGKLLTPTLSITMK